MKQLLMSPVILAASLALYSCATPAISLSDDIAMYKHVRINSRLIFVCGEDNESYYHIGTPGTRFL